MSSELAGDAIGLEIEYDDNSVSLATCEWSC